MFMSRYTKDDYLSALLPREEWRPFPPADDREAWEGLLDVELNQQRKALLIEEADAILETPWPQLPASLYMDFQRTGSRKNYELPYFERRNRLGVLALAECMTYEGKYLDAIVNGIWCILEEIEWCFPAHANLFPDLSLPIDPLPPHENEAVDLFACETAMTMAETLYLLEKPLKAVSRSLCERIREAVIARVIEPIETRTDHWWFDGENNWTPWCLSNTLGAAMVVFDDKERLANLCVRVGEIMDVYLGKYADDGGCDEGPAYWGVSPGVLLIYLELLHSRTNGKIDIYDEPKIQRMGQFIVTAQMTGKWFMNFADAVARVSPRRAIVYRYGERIGDTSMQDLALLGARNWVKTNPVSPVFGPNFCGAVISHRLRELFWFPAEEMPGESQPAKSTWYPDLQVLVAREIEAEGQGMVLAAKGGHNAENHNHNDVGQFMLFVDGQPGVVDIGVETYCKQTFSPDRYELWCIRSRGHNVPEVNGFEQCDGAEFTARNVAFEDSEPKQRVTMDLDAAYPKEAGIQTFRREFTFDREGSTSVTIQDSFAMKSEVPTVQVPLFTQANVTVTEPGAILIETTPRALALAYDAKVLQAEVTTVPLDDPQLSGVWGPELQKITFSYIGNKQEDEYALRFTAQKD